MRRPFLLALAGLALACAPAGPVQSSWNPAGPRPRKPVVEPTPTSDPQTVQAMHALLSDTDALRDAAIWGDHAKMHALATALEVRMRPSLEPDAPWQDAMSTVHVQVQRLANATNNTQSADALARIAKTCGDCHVATHATVGERLDRGPAPRPGPSSAEVMRVHRWATQQMWDSLVVPDQDRWVQGTTMFLVLPRCAGRSDVTAATTVDCNRASAIARKAHLDETPHRVDRMAELLTTCAPCHLAPAPQAWASPPNHRFAGNLPL